MCRPPEGVQAGDTPSAMGFGLYQGEETRSGGRHAPTTACCSDAFLPRLATHIEEQLLGQWQDNPELLYEGLKAYLMLTDPTHLDKSALKAFVTADWQISLPREVGPQQRQALERHLDSLLTQPLASAPIIPDSGMIERARAALVRTPLAQRIYNRLKREGIGDDLPEFTIAKVAGPSAPLVFARKSGAPLTQGVPGLFSFKGYHQAFVQASEQVTRQLAHEGWVLGLKGQDSELPPDAQKRVLEEVRRLYLEDYAQTWETFVDDIALAPAGSLQQSIQMASILSAADSPLPLLLRAIVKEVTLVRVEDADKSTIDKATDKVQEARDVLVKIFGQSREDTPTTSKVSLPENIVDARFEGLRRTVQSAAPGQPAPIDATLAVVNELYTLLLATDTAVKSGSPPPPSDVPTKLKAEALRLPEPVRSMFTTLSEGGARQALGATRANLSQAVGANIGAFCRQAISGRYPFVKSSSLDVTQADFAQMFGPGGLLDSFFQQQLAPYVDTSTRPWSFRRVGEASMGGNVGALLQFQRGQTIRDVFFRGGASVPTLRLEFKPVEMDPSITQFILDVDGQQVRYSHGPQVPMSVQWPGPRGSTQVRLEVSPAVAGQVSGQVYEGPWALFRMLDRAEMEATPQAERFIVTFAVGGRKAKFQMITGSVQNPFRLRELDQFRCPDQL